MADSSPRNVLIAGPPFRDYLKMIGDGFKACGVEPSLLEWQYPGKNLVQEILYYSSQRYRLRRADAQHKVNALAFEKAVQERRPDLILVMHAAELTQRTREYCKETGTKTVLWTYDSTAKFPVMARVAPMYDLVYTYEPADLQALPGASPPRLLPMAHDPRYYHRLPGSARKDIDICFVGALEPYPQRRRIIRHISSMLKDRTIVVWADSVHWYSHRKLRDVFIFGPRRNIQLHRQTLDHSAINDIYNRSRVCLNIHDAQSVKAANPRTFEILGSGGLLLTDRRLDDIEGFEHGDGYLHYANESELIDKLRAALDDEDKSRHLADIGHSKVGAHTYERRAKKILADLK